MLMFSYWKKGPLLLVKLKTLVNWQPFKGNEQNFFKVGLKYLTLHLVHLHTFFCNFQIFFLEWDI